MKEVNDAINWVKSEISQHSNRKLDKTIDAGKIRLLRRMLSKLNKIKAKLNEPS